MGTTILKADKRTAGMVANNDIMRPTMIRVMFSSLIIMIDRSKNQEGQITLRIKAPAVATIKTIDTTSRDSIKDNKGSTGAVTRVTTEVVIKTITNRTTTNNDTLTTVCNTKDRLNTHTTFLSLLDIQDTTEEPFQFLSRLKLFLTKATG